MSSKQQTQDALYNLRNEILRGQVAAGEKLRASHLADTMGFSRTPISKALQALEAEGLLIGDKSGFTVRSFTLADVMAAIDLRGLLEAAAAQQAAERGVTDTELRELKELLAEMDGIIKDGKLQDYDTLNEDFHTSLTDCCHSPILIDEVKRSYRFPFAGPSAFPSSPSPRLLDDAPSILLGQTHHRQIVEALEKRQSDRIFSLVREHARLAHKHVLDATKTDTAIPQLALVKA